MRENTRTRKARRARLADWPSVTGYGPTSAHDISQKPSIHAGYGGEGSGESHSGNDLHPRIPPSICSTEKRFRGRGHRNRYPLFAMCLCVPRPPLNGLGTSLQWLQHPSGMGVPHGVLHHPSGRCQGPLTTYSGGNRRPFLSRDITMASERSNPKPKTQSLPPRRGSKGRLLVVWDTDGPMPALPGLPQTPQPPAQPQPQPRRTLPGIFAWAAAVLSRWLGSSKD